MSHIILVMGESGTGKSTALRNLPPEETFIINVIDKPLPFKGFKKNYIQFKYDDKTDSSTGNYYVSDNHGRLSRMIQHINSKRPDIKNIIVDDFQYIMCNEYMDRAKETGFGKFTEIGQHAWDLIRKLQQGRPDIECFVLSHTENDQGKVKFKTIGKMLDEKITVEGMFTVVLHTAIQDGKYTFLTQNDGTHVAKSPMEMFKDKYIENDLVFVKQKINEYYNEDIAA